METPRDNSEQGRDFTPESRGSAGEPSSETPVSSEERFESAELKFDREAKTIIEATNKETARLAFGDFAKFVEFLADKPEVKGELTGALQEFSNLDDDEAATEAIAAARAKAKEYLEGSV